MADPVPPGGGNSPPPDAPPGRQLAIFSPPAGGEDILTGEVIAVLTVTGLLVLQRLLAALRDRTKRHRHTLEMQKSAFEELAVTQIVSFAMVIIEVSGALKSSATIVYTFENLHITLFVVSLLFLFLTLLLILLSIRVGNWWEHLEQSAFDVAAYRSLSARFLKLQHKLGLDRPEGGGRSSAGGSSLGAMSPVPEEGSASPSRLLSACLRCLPWWCQSPAGTCCSSRAASSSRPYAPPSQRAGRPYAPPPHRSGAASVFMSVRTLAWAALTRPRSVWRYLTLLPRVRFLEARYKFIRRNELPPDFSFTAYLRKAKHQVFRELVQVPPQIWFFFLIVLIFDMWTRAVSDAYHAAINELVALVAGAVGVMVGSLIAWIKMHRIHFRVLHSSYMQRTTIAAATAEHLRVLRELQAAQLRAQDPDAPLPPGGGVTDRADTLAECLEIELDATGVGAGGMVPPSPSRPGGSSGRAITAPASGSSGSGGDITGSKGSSGSHTHRGSMTAGALATTATTLQDMHIAAQRGLFWFGRPSLLLRVVQVLMFSLALVSALFIRFWYRFREPGTAWIPVLMGISVGVSLFLLQAIVPMYVITLHTGELVDLKLLVEAVQKQRENDIEKRAAAAEAAAKEAAVAARKAAAVAAAAAVGQSERRGACARASCWLSFRRRAGRVGLWLGTATIPRIALEVIVLFDFFLIAMLSSSWLPDATRREPVHATQLAFSALLLATDVLRLIGFGAPPPSLAHGDDPDEPAVVPPASAAVTSLLLGLGSTAASAYAFWESQATPPGAPGFEPAVLVPMRIAALIALRLLSSAALGLDAFGVPAAYALDDAVISCWEKATHRCSVRKAVPQMAPAVGATGVNVGGAEDATARPRSPRVPGGVLARSPSVGDMGGDADAHDAHDFFPLRRETEEPASPRAWRTKVGKSTLRLAGVGTSGEGGQGSEAAAAETSAGRSTMQPGGGFEPRYKSSRAGSFVGDADIAALHSGATTRALLGLPLGGALPSASAPLHGINTLVYIDNTVQHVSSELNRLCGELETLFGLSQGEGSSRAGRARTKSGGGGSATTDDDADSKSKAGSGVSPSDSDGTSSSDDDDDGANSSDGEGTPATPLPLTLAARRARTATAEGGSSGADKPAVPTLRLLSLVTNLRSCVAQLGGLHQATQVALGAGGSIGCAGGLEGGAPMRRAGSTGSLAEATGHITLPMGGSSSIYASTASLGGSEVPDVLGSELCARDGVGVDDDVALGMVTGAGRLAGALVRAVRAQTMSVAAAVASEAGPPLPRPVLALAASEEPATSRPAVASSFTAEQLPAASPAELASAAPRGRPTSLLAPLRAAKRRSVSPEAAGGTASASDGAGGLQAAPAPASHAAHYHFHVPHPQLPHLPMHLESVVAASTAAAPTAAVPAPEVGQQPPAGPRSLPPAVGGGGNKPVPDAAGGARRPSPEKEKETDKTATAAATVDPYGAWLARNKKRLAEDGGGKKASSGSGSAGSGSGGSSHGNEAHGSGSRAAAGLHGGPHAAHLRASRRASMPDAMLAHHNHSHSHHGGGHGGHLGEAVGFGNHHSHGHHPASHHKSRRHLEGEDDSSVAGSEGSGGSDEEDGVSSAAGPAPRTPAAAPPPLPQPATRVSASGGGVYNTVAGTRGLGGPSNSREEGARAPPRLAGLFTPPAAAGKAPAPAPAPAPAASSTSEPTSQPGAFTLASASAADLGRIAALIARGVPLPPEVQAQIDAAAAAGASGGGDAPASATKSLRFTRGSTSKGMFGGSGGGGSGEGGGKTLAAAGEADGGVPASSATIGSGFTWGRRARAAAAAAAAAAPAPSPGSAAPPAASSATRLTAPVASLPGAEVPIAHIASTDTITPSNNKSLRSSLLNWLPSRGGGGTEGRSSAAGAASAAAAVVAGGGSIPAGSATERQAGPHGGGDHPSSRRTIADIFGPRLQGGGGGGGGAGTAGSGGVAPPAP